MTTDTAPVYQGPIFDCDSHVHEHDFDFFAEYLPKKYHEKWLLQRKVGPDGEFGLYIGDRRVHNAEANAGGTGAAAGQAQGMAAGDEGRQVQRRGLDQADAGNLRPRCAREKAGRVRRGGCDRLSRRVHRDHRATTTRTSPAMPCCMRTTAICTSAGSSISRTASTPTPC